MRLVHAADIHLDSPLRGLGRLGAEPAEALRKATRQALDNLVALVHESGADALVIAGDLYDGNWNDYATGAYFATKMHVLADLEVPVIVASGNHDAESQITRSLRLPPNVRMLPTDAPGSVYLDDIGAVFHGQGYATRDVTTNLAAEYPRRVQGLVNVGVLHTAAMGSPDHDLYAPCSSADLEGLRYDYLALGHIHARGPVVAGEHPAWFSGNLQGRHARETGAKGALLVDFASSGPPTVAFRACDVARWETVELDASGMDDETSLLAELDRRLHETVGTAQGRTTVARVRVTGRSRMAGWLRNRDHVEAEFDLAAQRAGVILEKVRIDVRPPAAPDPHAARMRTAVAEALDDLAEDPADLIDRLGQLDRDLRDAAWRAELERGLHLDLKDPRVIRHLLHRAQRSLDARLAEQEG